RQHVRCAPARGARRRQPASGRRTGMERPFTNALWYLTLTRDELGSDAVRDRAITRGSGCYLYDRSGKRYLDARSGLWNVTLGYGNERVVRAMVDELARLPGGQIVRYDQPTEIALEY